MPPLCLRFVNVGRSSSLRRQIEFTTEDERITNEGTTERERMKCYINANGVTTRACQKSQQYAPKGQKLIAQGNTLGKSIANHYAPCKGKSVNYQCFCPCRAFCYFQSVHPRRCLGLCAFGAFIPFCLTFDTPSCF